MLPPMSALVSHLPTALEASGRCLSVFVKLAKVASPFACDGQAPTDKTCFLFSEQLTQE